MTPDKVSRTGTPLLPLAAFHRRIRNGRADEFGRIPIDSIPVAIIAFVGSEDYPRAVCVDRNGSVFHVDPDELRLAEPLEHPVIQAVYRAVFEAEKIRRGVR